MSSNQYLLSTNENTIITAIILRFILGITQTWLNVLSIKYLTESVYSNLLQINQAKFDKSRIDRLLSRDIDCLYERVVIIYKLIADPVCILITALCFLLLFSTIGIAPLLLAACFIPISWAITKISSNIYSQVMNASRDRTELTSLWIRLHEFIVNWGIKDELNKPIKSLNKRESSLRNKESIWRSVEIYLCSFGHILVALGYIGFLTLTGTVENGLSSVIFLLIPFISLLLGFSRYCVEYSIANISYKDLSAYFESTRFPDNLEQERIYLNESWSFWKGSLIENLSCKTQMDFAYSLLSALNLNQEFGLKSKYCLQDFKISSSGSNISEGQKTRLLIVRALCIADQLKVPVEINLSYASLDGENKKRLRYLLSTLTSFSIEVDESVIRGICPIDATHTDKILPKSAQSERFTVPSSRAVLCDIFSLLSPRSALLLIPAIVLSLVAESVHGEQLGIYSYVLYFLLVLFGVLIAIREGASIETKVRSKAETFLNKHLLQFDIKNKNDAIQRVTRDFTTVTEKISWYLHDLTWCSMLLIVAIFSVYYLDPLYGIIATILSFISCFILSITILPLVISTRRKSILGMNSFLDSVSDIKNMETTPQVSWVKEVKQKTLELGIGTFFFSRIQMYCSKTILTVYAQLLSGLFLLLLLQSMQFANQAAIFFILSALLILDQQITQLFLCFSGIQSQHISLERIRPSIKSLNEHESHVVFGKKGLTIASHKNISLEHCYSSVHLKPGVTGLIGPSGIGKTQFLRSVSCLDLEASATSEIAKDVFYFNHYSNKNLKLIHKYLDSINVETFILDLAKRKDALIILDEYTNQSTVEDASKYIHMLDTISRKNGSYVLVVDHRLNHPKEINAVNIITS